jgi:modulator of FtsH protease
MGAWVSFFAAAAGASATLAGLLVVAISINLSRILDYPHLPDRAASALVPLAGVLVVSMLALVPQPASLFAIEVLVAGIAMWAQAGFLLIKSFGRTPGLRRAWVLTHVPLNQAQTLPFVAAGVLLTLGFPSGLYWIVPGVIISLLAGIMNAWVLLIEILR